VVDLLPQLLAARILRLAAGDALRDGECELAAERFAVAARHVRALLAERLLLFGLIGTAAHGVLVETTADVVTLCPVVGLLWRVLEVLEQLDRVAYPADEVLRGEGSSSIAQMPALIAQDGGWRLRLFGEAAYGAQAGLIDHWREMVRASRGSAVEMRVWSRGETVDRPRGAVEVITAMMTPNLVDAAMKIQIRDASRQLALAALRLRIAALRQGSFPGLGSLPLELSGPTLYLGERIAATPAPGGGLQLALRETLADWKAHHGEQVRPPRMVWELPPVSD
jgi:hypothetical protein